MRLKQIELVPPGRLSDGWPKAFRSPGSVMYPRTRDRASLPKEWVDALRREGIPPIIFLNQAAVSGGDYRKVLDITKRYRLLYAKVVEELKGDPYLYKQARSAIHYYLELEDTGEMPNRCIKPPAWDAQQGISDAIVDVFTREYGVANSAHNSGYDMHTGIRTFGNCLVTCLYYVSIARRLGIKADIYSVPKHALAGIRLKDSVQFVDPSMGQKRIEPAKKEFPLPDGSRLEIDYRNPKKADVYGLYETWFNKGSAILETATPSDECGETPGKPPSESKVLEAIEAFDESIKIDPKSAEAWNNRGYAFSQLATYEMARGRRESARSRYHSALKSYLTALRLSPDCPLTWFNKGVVCAELGRAADAVASFDESLRLDKGRYAAWYHKARSLRMISQIQKMAQDEKNAILREALYAYEQATALNPRFVMAWFEKGDLRYRIGRFEDAVASFDAALAVCPRYWRVLDYKGNALYRLKRFEAAVEAFDKALQINPRNGEIWNNKAGALYELGRLEEAEKALTKAVKLQPKLTNAWNNKSELLLKIGRPQAALEAAERAIKLDPGFAEAWKNKGNALSALGRNEEAEKAHAKAREIS